MDANSIYLETQKVKNLPDFVDFTASNFTDLEVKFPVEILKSGLINYANKREYRPDSKGVFIARQAISDYYQNERNTTISPDNIIITSSTSESYNLLFSLFTNPEDEILLPSPTYPLFSYFAELTKINVSYYNLDLKNEWRINFDSLEKQINKKTKFIVLISPNNPTGQIMSKEDFEKVLEIASEKNIFVIIDEVFSEFIYDKKERDYFPSAGSGQVAHNDLPVIFIFNGISKMFALPDFKLAWIGVVGEQTRVEEVVEKLEIANDAFLNANYATQSMLSDIFEKSNEFRQDLHQLLENKAERLNSKLRELDFVKFSPIKGGIHGVISILKSTTKFDEEEIVIKLLKDNHILVHPGYFYELESDKYLNFVITTFNSEKIDNLISSINNLL